MKRGGQISTFLILGIILVFIVGLFWYYQESAPKKMDEKQSEISPSDSSFIQMYVTSCIERTIKRGMVRTALEGSYFHPPEDALDVGETSIAFWRTSEGNPVPTNEVLAQELAQYVDTMLSSCIQDVSALENQGISLKVKEPKTVITLAAPEILAQTTMEVRATKQDKEILLNTFTTATTAEQFFENIALAREIATTKKEICLSCISSTLTKQKTTILILSHPSKNRIIQLTDADYLLTDKPFVLRFALQNND